MYADGCRFEDERASASVALARQHQYHELSSWHGWRCGLKFSFSVDAGLLYQMRRDGCDDKFLWGLCVRSDTPCSTRIVSTCDLKASDCNVASGDGGAFIGNARTRKRTTADNATTGRCQRCESIRAQLFRARGVRCALGIGCGGRARCRQFTAGAYSFLTWVWRCLWQPFRRRARACCLLPLPCTAAAAPPLCHFVLGSCLPCAPCGRMDDASESR